MTRSSVTSRATESVDEMGFLQIPQVSARGVMLSLPGRVEAGGSWPVVAESRGQRVPGAALALHPEARDGGDAEPSARGDGAHEVVRIGQDLEEARDIAARRARGRPAGEAETEGGHVADQIGLLLRAEGPGGIEQTQDAIDVRGALAEVHVARGHHGER